MGGGLELTLLIDSGYEKPKKTRSQAPLPFGGGDGGGVERAEQNTKQLKLHSTEFEDLKVLDSENGAGFERFHRGGGQGTIHHGYFKSASFIGGYVKIGNIEVITQSHCPVATLHLHCRNNGIV